MNKKLTTDENTLKTLYREYKNYLLPLGVVLVSIFLFVEIIIPQFLGLGALAEKAKIERDKLAILQSNLQVLTNLDEASLEDNFNSVIKVLPNTKDFAGILSGVGLAAYKTGVSLGDFDFQVGDLSNTSGSVTSVPTLNMDLHITGNINQMSDFISELNKTVPLSEVVGIKGDVESSVVTTIFYYKPFPTFTLNENIQIKTLSASDLNLISQFSKWNNAKEIQNVIIPQASESGSFSATNGPF